MSGLSDDKKWEVYSVFLSSDFFCDDRQPDPACLEALLRELGVTLDQIERLIEGEGAVRQAAEGAEPARAPAEAG